MSKITNTRLFGMFCLSAALGTAFFASSCGDTEDADDGSSASTAVNVDTAFGTDGTVTTTTTLGTEGSEIEKLLVDSSDKIYAVGHYGDSDAQLAVVRYDKDGAVDTSYGSSGMLVNAVTSKGFSAVDADFFDSTGQLVAVASVQNLSGYNFAVARVTATGALDTSFGTSGVASINIGLSTVGSTFSQDYPKAVTVRRLDGATFIAGDSTVGGATSCAIMGLDSSGALKTNSWGTTGIVNVLFGAASASRCMDVVAMDDGRIVVAGIVHNGTDYDFAVARLTSAGTLDTSFATNGYTTVNIASNDYVQTVLVDADGNVVIAGYSDNGTSGTSTKNIATLAKFTSAGALDTSFGTAGVTTYSSNYGDGITYGARYMDAAMASDGKIYLAGPTGGTNFGFVTLLRLLSTGTADTTYGTGGLSGVDKNNAGVGTTKSVAIQSTGKILVGGKKGADKDKHFNIVRFTTGG